MIRIDCLLANTTAHEELKGIIKVIGDIELDKDEGTDVSLRNIYNTLKKHDIEADLESTAKTYDEVFKDRQHEGFESLEETSKQAIKPEEAMIAHFIAQKDKTGVQKLDSDLSVAKTAVKQLLNLFTAANTADLRTKTLFKQISDRYQKVTKDWAKSHGGEVKEGEKWHETVARILDEHNKGLTDLNTDQVKGLIDLHNDALKELDNAENELNKSGADEFTKQQFREYIQGIRDAEITFMRTEKEGKNVINGALMDKFGKTTKSGKQQLDFEKLVGDKEGVAAISQLRDNVMEAMQKHGFDKETASKVADALQREYRDIAEESKRQAIERFDKRAETQKDKPSTPKNSDIDISKIVKDRVGEAQNVTGLGAEDFTPNVSRAEGEKLLKEAFEKSGLTKEVKGKQVLDLDKVSSVIDNREDIYNKVKDQAKAFLEERKQESGKAYTEQELTDLVDSMNSSIDTSFEKVRQFVIDKRTATEQTWESKPVQQDKSTINEMINKGLFEFNRYKTITGDKTKGLLYKLSEANKIFSDALTSLGFSKTSKAGKEVIDHEKLAGHVGSESEIRDLVFKEMKKKGFDDTTANEIADSMKKKIVSFKEELKNKDIERAKKRAESFEDKTSINSDKNISDVISDRVNEVQQHNSLHEDNFTATVSKKEANKLLESTFIDNGLSKKDKNGKDVIDIDAVSKKYDDKNSIYNSIDAQVEKYLQGKPHTQKDVFDLTNSMHKVIDSTFEKVREHVTKKQERIEKAWDKAESLKKQPKTLLDTVLKRINDLGDYNRKNPELPKRKLKFMPDETRSILSDTLRNSDKYGRTSVTGDKKVNWLKIAEETPSDFDIRDMVIEQWKDQVGEERAKQIANALMGTDEMKQFLDDLSSYKDEQLKLRQSTMYRESPQRKSDIQRLSELNALGLFENSGYDDLLKKVAGINSKDIEDVGALKELANQWQSIQQSVDFSSYAATTKLQTIQKEMNAIVFKNKGNKTAQMKRMRLLNDFVQLQNISMITGYRNLLENTVSGFIETFTAQANLVAATGFKLAFDKSLRNEFINTWRDIARGGTEYGQDTHAGLGGKGSIMERLNPQDWAKMSYPKRVLTMAVQLPRMYLNATDGAYKSVIHRLHLMSMMHEALTHKDGGGMTKKESVEFIHNTLFGDNSIQLAREKVNKMYQLAGFDLTKVRETELVRATHDMVLSEITNGTNITDDHVKAMVSSSYHLAGLGMGHEANNWGSRQLHNMQSADNRKLDVLISTAQTDEDFAKVATQTLNNTLTHNVLLRFSAAQMNWGVIRLQQSGLGALTGVHKLISIYLGGVKGDVDFTDTKKITERLQAIQKARQEIARTVVGLGVQALTYGGLHAIAAQMFKDDKDPYHTLLSTLKENHPELNRIFFKLALPFQYLSYILHNGSPSSNEEAIRWGLEKSESNNQYYPSKDENGLGLEEGEAQEQGLKGKKVNKSALAFGIANSLSQLTNFGDNMSLPVRINQYIDELGKGGKNAEKAWGGFGQLVGSYLQIPFIKPTADVAKGLGDVYSVFKYGKTNIEPTHQYPMTFLRGMAVGSLLQNTGVLSNNPPIEELPGIGEKYTEIFHDHDIYSILDIKDAGGMENAIEDINHDIKRDNRHRRWNEGNLPELSEKVLRKAIKEYQHNESFYKEGPLQKAVTGGHIKEKEKQKLEDSK